MVIEMDQTNCIQFLLPSGKTLIQLWNITIVDRKSMENSTILMAIFPSYVELPEGIFGGFWCFSLNVIRPLYVKQTPLKHGFRVSMATFVRWNNMKPLRASRHRWHQVQQGPDLRGCPATKVSRARGDPGSPWGWSHEGGQRRLAGQKLFLKERFTWMTCVNIEMTLSKCWNQMSGM